MAYTILQYEGQLQILKGVTLGVHTPKHNRLRQNKQAQNFKILITYLNANDPTAQITATHNSCLNSFGTYSS
jgi:hypothetical protein